jgi:hypothetical protein
MARLRTGIGRARGDLAQEIADAMQGHTGRRGPTRITCYAAKGRVSVPQARAEHVTFASGARCSALASLVGAGASGTLRRSVPGAPRGSPRF